MNNNWTKGCDFGFKVGHKAWHSQRGWGTVVEVYGQSRNYPILWKCSGGVVFDFNIDGRMRDDDEYPSLFHVEQTFDYSRPKWQPEPGELCWVWKDGWQVPNTRVFSYFADDAYWCRTTCGDNEMPYTYCAPFNGGQLPEQFAHLLKGGSE